MRDAHLGRVEKALKVAVPQLRKLTFERDKRGIPHLKGKCEHWRPEGAWQNEADFSDGTLRLIGLLWSLLDGSGPWLLEKPELSLHPGIVQHVPQMMCRVQRDQKKALRQIFLSSHSANLFRDEGIAAGEVLMFIPSTKGSIVTTANNEDEVRDPGEAGLAVGRPAGQPLQGQVRARRLRPRLFVHQAPSQANIDEPGYQG